MTNKELEDNQYTLCTKYNNHPKEDIDICRGCELKKKCTSFQRHLQPELPWVRTDTIHDGRAITYNVTPATNCRNCRHYIEPKPGYPGFRCKAYPEKIPTEIRLGYVSHNQPYKGDQGILFEPVDDSEAEKK